jgi:hydrogenase/urease accessory protein HupE
MRPSLAALLGLFLSVALQAHELGVIQVTATFRGDATYHLAIAIDEQHIPELPAPGHPPGETRWGRIQGLTPPLQERIGELAQALADHSAIVFDGRPAPPRTLRVAEPPPTEDPFAPAPRPTLHLKGRIPGGAQTFTWSTTLGLGSYPLALQNEGDPAPARQWLIAPGKSQPFRLAARLVPPTRGQIAWQYLQLGFTHILPKGLDHILFVLGIFLLSLRLKPMLLQVTAFTLAHTLTLALTVYGLVALSPRIVEPLIALSIAYVGIENVVTRELKRSRVVLVFAFGLLHGMGFAGVLSELGLPRSEFLTGVVAFNLGVEAGQLTVIGLAFLLIALPFRRFPWYRARIVIPASLLIAAVGLYWAIQRAFF